MSLLPNRTDNDNQLSSSTRDFSSPCGKLTTGQCFAPSPFCTRSTCDFLKPCDLKNVGLFRPSRFQIQDLSHFPRETHCCVENNSRRNGKVMFTTTWIQEIRLMEESFVNKVREPHAESPCWLLSQITAFPSSLWTGPQTCTSVTSAQQVRPKSFGHRRKYEHPTSSDILCVVCLISSCGNFSKMSKVFRTISMGTLRDRSTNKSQKRISHRAVNI